ncbi:MAG: hypothetical protein ACXVGN_00070 [Mycobacteriaceae bacterium]
MSQGTNGDITPYDPGAAVPTAPSGAMPSGAPTPAPATNAFGGSASQNDWTSQAIFSGYTHVRAPVDTSALPHGGQMPVGESVKVPEYMTALDYLAQFDQFTRTDYLKFRNLFIAAGLVPESVDPMSVRTTFESLLHNIADMTKAGAHISPMGYLRNLIRMNGLDPSKVPATPDFTLKTVKPLDPWTQTTKSVYDVSPEQARSTLEGAITKMLGRAPSEAEIHDFINAAQTAAAKHPTTQTATFTPGDTGLTGKSSSTVTEGGVTTHEDATGTTVVTQHQGYSAADIAAMAERRAKNAPDYASYQAVATYFPALMQMLGSTTGS